jgi:hypothetical protein
MKSTPTSAIQGAVRSTGNAAILERLWRRLPHERENLRPHIEKARSYRNECGCAMGGVFLIAALVLVTLDGVFFHRLSGRGWFTEALRGSAVVFGAGIFGKAIGIGFARTRLALVYRTVRIRYHGMGD